MVTLSAPFFLVVTLGIMRTIRNADAMPGSSCMGRGETGDFGSVIHVGFNFEPQSNTTKFRGPNMSSALMGPQPCG